MGADTIISGVVRGLLPYAAIGGAAFLGYTYLRKRGVINDIKTVVDDAAELPTKALDILKKRTGADKFADGDFIGGAQTIIRNVSPVVNLAEKGWNLAADTAADGWEKAKDIIPDEPPQIPEPTQENTGIPETTWTESVLKYVPAVAARNAFLKVFG